VTSVFPIRSEPVQRLRKAIEIAKQLRQERTAREPGEPAPAPPPRDGDGWFSPAYTECSPRDLDPATLEANRCVGCRPDADELESYKVLRTQVLQRTIENGWNTVMVTSALPREGKTLTAINLAFAFAREFGRTVLLVDCDLKQQKVHEYLGLASDRGLIDYLENDLPFKDILIWPGVEKLTLVSGGRKIRESAELLGSGKMKALVAEMKSRYRDRYIFFDVPPLLAGADAIAFASLVDCILMVVEAGKTSIHDVRKAFDLMPGEKVLGFVLNRHQTLMEEYVKYYRVK
jgi:non-specific protein-tyrosine kinase